jgi:hypothetical protein
MSWVLILSISVWVNTHVVTAHTYVLGSFNTKAQCEAAAPKPTHRNLGHTNQGAKQSDYACIQVRP